MGGARASAPGARKKAKLATKPSDLELYERRSEYWFAEGTPISRRVPPKETPEEQVTDMCAWDFFRFVHLRGGRESLLEWYEPECMPVVTMTPALKLGIGSSFSFGARWALMQYHPWCDRRRFVSMSDGEVTTYFRAWRLRPECPWYVVDQYLEENGRRGRAGQGTTAATRATPLLPETEYDARMLSS